MGKHRLHLTSADASGGLLLWRFGAPTRKAPPTTTPFANPSCSVRIYPASVQPCCLLISPPVPKLISHRTVTPLRGILRSSVSVVLGITDQKNSYVRLPIASA